MKTKCNNCGHEWISKSKLIMVTCPSCMLKTKMEENKNGEMDNATISEEQQNSDMEKQPVVLNTILSTSQSINNEVAER